MKYDSEFNGVGLRDPKKFVEGIDLRYPGPFDTMSAAEEHIQQRTAHYDTARSLYSIVEVPEPASDKPDMVGAPPHYTKLDPQPIEVIEAWDLDFFLGNALKYIARCKYKGNETQDLEKAVSYLQRRIRNLKGQA